MLINVVSCKADEEEIIKQILLFVKQVELAELEGVAVWKPSPETMTTITKCRKTIFMAAGDQDSGHKLVVDRGGRGESYRGKTYSILYTCTKWLLTKNSCTSIKKNYKKMLYTSIQCFFKPKIHVHLLKNDFFET